MELKEFERFLELKKEIDSQFEKKEIGMDSQKSVREYYNLKNKLEQFVFDNQNNQEKIICKLKTSLETWRYKINFEKTNESLNEIKVIKEIMALLDTYDWKDYCSEYAREKEGKMVKEVATWKQDSNQQVRNHKTYIVEEYSKLFEKYQEINLDQLGIYQCFCEDAMTAVFAKIDKETNALDYKNIISLANYDTESNQDNNIKKLKELYKEYDILNPLPEIDFSKYTEEQKEEISKMLDVFNKRFTDGGNTIGNALKSIMVRVKQAEQIQRN